jgi:hypothetical protein
MTKDEALEKAIDIAESWIRDQLEGTGMFNDAIKELAPLKEALAQPEQEKERCVGCEACIDTACGRDECPKGWPKAAQPEQEPVAWGVDWGKAGDIACVSIIKRLPNDVIEVVAVEYAPYSYTTPPQRTWVGMTDEEIDVAIKAAKKVDTGYAGWVRDQRKEYAKAIEAKLKEKNNA